MANRKYKDSLFRTLFNHPSPVLSLYRAVSPETPLPAEEEIRINTLDSVLRNCHKINCTSCLSKSRLTVSAKT